MKTQLCTLLSLCTFVMAAAAQAETYKIAPGPSKVTFKIQNKAPGSPSYQVVPGSFKNFSGTLVWDQNDLPKSSVVMEVQTASIDTAIGRRDDHLRSADFFKVKEFPTMSFKSAAIKKLSDDTYQVSGHFTLLGKTKPLTVSFKSTGNGAGQVHFKIKRSDFGMTFRIPDTGDEVDVTLEIAGTKA